jgi:hypothetical protein
MLVNIVYRLSLLCFLFFQVSVISANSFSNEFAYLVWRNDHYLNNISIIQTQPFPSIDFFNEPLYKVTKAHDKIIKVSSIGDFSKKEEYEFNKNFQLVKSISGLNVCNYEYENSEGVVRNSLCLDINGKFLEKSIHFYDENGLLIKDKKYSSDGVLISYRTYDYGKKVVEEYKSGIRRSWHFEIDKLWSSKNVD